MIGTHLLLTKETKNRKAQTSNLCLITHTKGIKMAIVEIHIKNNTIEKVSGENTIVYIHDHDSKITTTMLFKKQEQKYEQRTRTNSLWFSDIEEIVNKK